MRCAIEALERLEYSKVLLGKHWGRHTDYPVAIAWAKAAGSQIMAVFNWTDISLRIQSDMGIHEDSSGPSTKFGPSATATSAITRGKYRITGKSSIATPWTMPFPST